MSKTVSARIEKEIHQKLTERCNKIGCTVNDYLNGAIELALTGTTEQDLGDELDNDSPTYPESKTETKTEKNTHENKTEISTAKIKRISYDGGKTWVNV